MPREVNWARLGYESRIDAAADNLSDFIDAVLGTIDEDAARDSAAQWEIVRRYFAGCAFAAQQQRGTEGEGAKRIAEYLRSTFNCGSIQSGEGFSDGFDEFMDWLSNPAQFSPTALRARLDECK